MNEGLQWIRQIAYPWRIGISFCIATVMVLLGLIWMTILVIRLERSEANAKQGAELEENLRLALWRIDSTLSPILAQESFRPNSVPSTSPYVKLCFQFAPDGSLSTPKLSQTAQRDQLIQEFSSKVSKDSLFGVLSKEASGESSMSTLSNATQSAPTQSLSSNNLVNRSQLEFEQRRGNVFTNNAIAQNIPQFAFGLENVSSVSLIPISHHGELLLVRKVISGGNEFAQGCWLDWPALQTKVQELVADLLPDASLELCKNGTLEDGSNMLASIPARLNPRKLSTQLNAISSQTGWLLGMTWIGVLSALTASAGLILGSIRLAERRAAFVASVTHELRTPLTTFLMYTEMLSQGMVPDPIAQKQYIDTLRHEALRLEHLVENVLAYAKLERGRTPQPLQLISVESLLKQTLPYLKQRAAAALMELEVPETPNPSLRFLASPSVVEQIMLNLVDNACKYAARSSGRKIQLLVGETTCSISIGIRDFGPGFPVQRMWFRPFHKTVEEAANSAPGVGLGLSLCKRLAEQMNGSLQFESVKGDGAYVKLVLRRK